MRYIKKVSICLVLLLGVLLRCNVARAETLVQALEAQSGQSLQRESVGIPTSNQIEISADAVANNNEELEERARQEAERARQAKERENELRQIRANGLAVVDSSATVGSPGPGWCAMWVSQCYQKAGFGYPGGNACDLYYRYCTCDDLTKAKPGMIIAAPSHPHTRAGSIYGHCGILFERDGRLWVRHNVGSISEDPIEEWIGFYGATSVPRWGYAF